MANFPNYPFSLILNVENNPYISNMNIQQSYSKLLLELSGAGSLEALNQQAIERVKTLAKNQRGIYDEINKEIQAVSGKTLQQILQDSLQEIKQEKFVNKELTDQQITIQQAKKQLIQENKVFTENYLSLLAKLAQARTEEEVETIINSLEKSFQKIGAALALARNESNDIKERLQRISSSQNTNPVSQYLSFSPDGSLQVARGKHGTALTRAFHEYRDFIQKEGKMGTRFTSGRQGKKGSFSQQRDIKIARLRKELITYFTDKNDGDQATAEIIADNFIYLTNQSFFQNNQTFDLSKIGKRARTAQEGGYIWEVISNTLTQKELTEALKKNPDIIITGGAIEGHVRVMYRKILDKKTKNSIKTECERIRTYIEQEYSDLIESFNALDKIDDYINLQFGSKQTKKYTLAFSDKMYANIKNISILTGINELEGQISGASNLINTYDLISQIGASADGFMFAALNASTASAFYNEHTTSTIRQELTKLFSSYIYEVAYNPKSFVDQVLTQIGFENSKVLYLHRIGAQVIPAFVMLDKVALALQNLALKKIEKMELVKVQLGFDNSDPKVIEMDIREKYLSNSQNATYPEAAWKYVAAQVANNTLVNMHLDITPLASALEGAW